MSLIEEHVKLTNSILSGEINKNGVISEIKRIEDEYGESAFNTYKVDKKGEPWSEKDLEELKIKSASGACSKEFYLYMAEVSDYVHGKRGFSLKKLLAKKWLIVLALVIIVSIIVGCVIFVNR